MNNNGSMNYAIKHLIIGVLMGFAITAIVFLGYAMLITYTQMSERSLHMVVAVTTLLSVLVAGFDAARAAPYKGWLWGMGAGFLYIAILAIIMMVMLPGFGVDGRTLLVLVLAILGGGLGGILGINVKR
ncbi:MAG: TIGR04086 family membrane protein [Defluviitaleaceae bacterium]|nr:TIGR04086 family membrane protein [Defluviitaleaceae bacterium]MCL2239718.1 TIGR04086 family membrane protein [Defluviitaleaceae bacterium]